MTSRMGAGMPAGVVAAVLAVGLAGCSGAAPKASPSPTPPFASADAAYEAAEATYRGYVDAGNHVDLADRETFVPLLAMLTGDALETDRQQLTEMADKGWNWAGDSQIVLVKRVDRDDADPLWGNVQLAVCLDVHAIKVTDRKGESVVAKDRPKVQALAVDLVGDASSSTGMKIIGLNKRADDPECAN